MDFTQFIGTQIKLHLSDEHSTVVGGTIFQINPKLQLVTLSNGTREANEKIEKFTNMTIYAHEIRDLDFTEYTSPTPYNSVDKISASPRKNLKQERKVKLKNSAVMSWANASVEDIRETDFDFAGNFSRFDKEQIVRKINSEDNNESKPKDERKTHYAYHENVLTESDEDYDEYFPTDHHVTFREKKPVSLPTNDLGHQYLHSPKRAAATERSSRARDKLQEDVNNAADQRRRREKADILLARRGFEYIYQVSGQAVVPLPAISELQMLDIIKFSEEKLNFTYTRMLEIAASHASTHLMSSYQRSPFLIFVTHENTQSSIFSLLLARHLFLRHAEVFVMFPSASSKEVSLEIQHEVKILKATEVDIYFTWETVSHLLNSTNLENITILDAITGLFGPQHDCVDPFKSWIHDHHRHIDNIIGLDVASSFSISGVCNQILWLGLPKLYDHQNSAVDKELLVDMNLPKLAVERTLFVEYESPFFNQPVASLSPTETVEQ